MTSPTELPPHVRRLVDEIESEIGETDVAADDIVGATGRPDVVARRGRSRRRSARSSSRSARIPDRQGLLRDAGARPPDVHRADGRLPRRPRPAHQQRGLRRRLQRDGRRQGHPVLLAVRAPPAAVLRDGGGGVHPAGPGHRALEDPAGRRDVRPPAPGPGAADPAGRRVPPGSAEPAGRRRRGRGDPPVRGDARGAQARDGDDDVGGPRPVPVARPDPRGVLRPPRPTGARALRAARNPAARRRSGRDPLERRSSPA